MSSMMVCNLSPHMPVRMTMVLMLRRSMRDHFLGIDAISDADGIVGVGVHIDHRKLRARDFVYGGMKRGLGVKVPEQDGLLAVGVGGGLVADAGLLCRTLWAGGESQEQSRGGDPFYLYDDHVGPASGSFFFRFLKSRTSARTGSLEDRAPPADIRIDSDQVPGASARH